MKKIEITDSAKEELSLEYISSSIGELVKDFGGDISSFNRVERVGLVISCPENYFDLFKSEIEDKIADVIAVKYKYSFLKSKMYVAGLSEYESEILYTTVISADLEDDKRYIVRKLKAFDKYVIDGIFNFRLQPLKSKWKEVASYIPFFFSSRQLCDFISYVLGEKRGKKVLIDGKSVYDLNFNRLKRSVLLSHTPDVVKEALLSPCAYVEVVNSVSTEEEKQLKKFFGQRVSFSSGSLQKTVDKKN